MFYSCIVPIPQTVESELRCHQPVAVSLCSYHLETFFRFSIFICSMLFKGILLASPRYLTTLASFFLIASVYLLAVGGG